MAVRSVSRALKVARLEEEDALKKVEGTGVASEWHVGVMVESRLVACAGFAGVDLAWV
jgi:hypothetical protein